MISIPKATFTTCILTCLAYEAMRINGWLNRFTPDWNGDTTALYNAAVTNWNAFSVVAYLTVLLPYLVTRANRSRPRIQLGWFLIALIALALACVAIPDAKTGRWASTNDRYLLVYWLVLLVPALGFILWGLYANKRTAGEIQSDV